MCFYMTNYQNMHASLNDAFLSFQNNVCTPWQELDNPPASQPVISLLKTHWLQYNRFIQEFRKHTVVFVLLIITSFGVQNKYLHLEFNYFSKCMLTWWYEVCWQALCQVFKLKYAKGKSLYTIKRQSNEWFYYKNILSDA